MRRRSKTLSLTGSLLLASSSFPATAAWQAVGEVESISHTGNALTLSTVDGAHVQLSMPMPDVVRVRMTPRAAFEPDVSYAIAPGQQSAIDLLVEDDAV